MDYITGVLAKQTNSIVYSMYLYSVLLPSILSAILFGRTESILRLPWIENYLHAHKIIYVHSGVPQSSHLDSLLCSLIICIVFHYYKYFLFADLKIHSIIKNLGDWLRFQQDIDKCIDWFIKTCRHNCVMFNFIISQKEKKKQEDMESTSP